MGVLLAKGTARPSIRASLRPFQRIAAIALPLILTRPRPAALRFARMVRAGGFDGAILFSPLLRIVDVAPPDLPPGLLILTSEHGARRAGALGLSGRSGFAVGGRTAAVARAAGLDVTEGPGDADGLCDMLLARADGPFLHLHGRHVTGDLTGRLRAAGRAAEARIVYDQEALGPTRAARGALERGRCLVPLFSPRTARLLGAALDAPPPEAIVLAMSRAVGEAWPFASKVHIAHHADAAGMAALVAGQRER